MNDKKDHPNVIAPPPLIFLSGLLVGGLIAWQNRWPIWSSSVGLISGGLLIVVGLGIILTAWLQMRRAQTNIEPWKPTTAILDTGLYAVSRNPIYAAMVLIYLGVSFAFNSVWFLPFLPVVVLIIQFGVIRREEEYLTRKFGAEYQDYMRRVRRWT